MHSIKPIVSAHIQFLLGDKCGPGHRDNNNVFKSVDETVTVNTSVCNAPVLLSLEFFMKGETKKKLAVTLQ